MRTKLTDWFTIGLDMMEMKDWVDMFKWMQICDPGPGKYNPLQVEYMEKRAA